MTEATKKQSFPADLHTIRAMSPKDYRAYLESIIYVDHHEIMRSLVDGHIFAVTSEQAKAFLDYVRELAPQIGEK